MVTKSKVVEVEMVTPNNRQVYFKPIGHKLRGRMDFTTARTRKEEDARKAWPEPVPGQRVCLDLGTGERYVREPLYDEDCEQTRAKIIRKGYGLPPKRADYGGENMATWVHHLHKLINAGLARVVEGELPNVEDFDEEPRTRFITSEKKSDEARLTETIIPLTKAVERLADRVDAVIQQDTTK